MTSSSRPSLRREVLGSFAILLAGGILLACLGLVVVYPLLSSPGQAVAYVLALVVGDLMALYFFGRWLLESRLVQPVNQLVEDTERIAGGDYRHRVAISETAELEALGHSVNALADRLIREQERLAENVASLERTNRELVEARNEVLRAARLASAGTLASGIAHEVGNPLSALFSYVDIALKRAESAGPDRPAVDPELLGSIRQEASRIDRIVRGLLDYARPQSDEGGLARPEEVVDHVLELLEEQGRLDGVDLAWRPPESDFVVRMDAHRLEHVLMNLLLNGLDALSDRADPRIRVSLGAEAGGASRMPIRREGDPPGVNYAHRRRVAIEQDGAVVDPLWTSDRIVTLVVEDNGPGIPEEDVERVFDPFFTTKDPGKGTGLGLAVCARLVEGMGGEIDLENRKQGGARFTLRLPAVMESGESTESAEWPRSENSTGSLDSPGSPESPEGAESAERTQSGSSA